MLDGDGVNVSYWRCRCGYQYTIGNCAMPNYQYRCPGSGVGRACGLMIGGTNRGNGGGHGSGGAAEGQTKIARADMANKAQPGYHASAVQAEGASGYYVGGDVRRAAPNSQIALRLVLHSLLHVAASVGAVVAAQQQKAGGKPKAKAKAGAKQQQLELLQLPSDLLEPGVLPERDDRAAGAALEKEVAALVKMPPGHRVGDHIAAARERDWGALGAALGLENDDDVAMAMHGALGAVCLAASSEEDAEAAAACAAARAAEENERGGGGGGGGGGGRAQFFGGGGRRGLPAAATASQIRSHLALAHCKQEADRRNLESAFSACMERVFGSRYCTY